MLHNILLPTDFSELSSYAASLADKIAYSLGARLHLLKVVPVASDVYLSENGELSPDLSTDVSVLENEKLQSESQIIEFSKKLKSVTTSSVVYGQIVGSITEYAKNNKIDLIIMGTHGTSGLKEILTGSVTESVIKHCKTPVLSLKCSRENIDFSDILITGDFPAKSSADLELVKLLQQIFGTKLHLLWVNTKKEFLTSLEAIEKMKIFAAKNQLEKVLYHIHNDHSVEEGIMNFANSYDATHKLDIDLIAVEKKNKTELGYILSGCQAISLVNHVFRPIITYRVS